jgi:site-specific DNA-methyltransferase (adenine-specific)
MSSKRCSWEIRCGDATRELESVWADSVDIVVTSPPYYRQRDYGENGQLGHESSPEAYVERLVDILEAVRRVVKTTGSMWLVLGDKYEDGRLLGLPWRIVLKAQETGWILRTDIIWHKPNAMPSPARNRPTVDHEYIFFLVKSSQYYYDADAIREPHVTFSPQSRMRGGRRHFFQRGGTPEKGKNSGASNLHDARWDQAFHPKGRNKRTVWSIPLSKYRGAHFAVFPEPLVQNCILAASPPGGLVLDPFVGSGTTGAVALRLERNFLGIDCNPGYCELAEERLTKSSRSTPLGNDVVRSSLPKQP